nr:MAG TPA: hypothetical protein [Caudoviricetes sp.]
MRTITNRDKKLCHIMYYIGVNMLLKHCFHSLLKGLCT